MMGLKIGWLLNKSFEEIQPIPYLLRLITLNMKEEYEFEMWMIQKTMMLFILAVTIAAIVVAILTIW
jgi:hypothetical protein